MNRMRNSQLDILKGIGISLVLVGHVSRNGVLNNWIYSFHMPLFFFISGALYYLSKKVDSKSFFKKKFQGLIVPYFVFALLTFIYWVVIERYLRASSGISVGQQFLEIFISQGGDESHEYNVVLWFLPCLFMMEIIFDWIYKKFKKNKGMLVSMILFSTIGYVLSKFCPIRLPWSLDTMCVAIPFYAMGFFVAPHLDKVNSNIIRYKWGYAAILTIISGIIAVTYGGSNLNNNTYSNYILFYFVGVIGILFMIVLSNLVGERKSILFLGTNTLILMCIHEPLKRILLIIVSKLSRIRVDVLRSNIITILIVTIILLGIMYPAIIIINRYLPFMLGRRKSVDNCLQKAIKNS